MEINFTNYDKFILDNFKTLSNKIKIISGKTLSAESFKQVFGSSDAKLAKHCIYIWRTETKIPRVKGESNIIYIGKTNYSLKGRHYSSSELKASSVANKQKYNDIVNRYGPISIHYYSPDKFTPHNSSELLRIEGQFLWWYFQNHSEYPPINYTKTKIRNNIVKI